MSSRISFCLFFIDENSTKHTTPQKGRYLFFNAMVNQLRYPNSHTNYFSCTLLYLFSEANTEAIQEQMTRVGWSWECCGMGDDVLVWLVLLCDDVIRKREIVRVMIGNCDGWDYYSLVIDGLV